MKKSLLGVMLLALLAVLSGCASASGSGKAEYVYSFNIQPASTHKFHTDVVAPWAEYVEEQTDGRVKIEIYNSGALGNLASAYEDIEGGLYDIGYVSPSASTSTPAYPLTLGDLPFAILDPMDSPKVLQPFIDEFMQDEFEDSIPLAISATDAYQLITTEPVETVEDVKHKKVIVSGKERVELVSMWGGVPVTLGLEENYQALDRGTVDQTAYTAIGANGFRLFEAAPYLTKVDIGATTLLFLMNERAFDKLPDDLKKQFKEDFGPKLSELNSKMYSEGTADALVQFEQEVADKGGRVIIPEGETLAEFRAPAKQIWEDWVKNAEKQGYDNAQEMMDFFTKTLEEQGIDNPVD